MSILDLDINPVNPSNPAMHESESGSSNKLLELCLRFGSMMNESGAESARTEDSIERILSAYGSENVSAFSLPTLVLITFKDQDGIILTSSKRIGSQEDNFEKIDALNNLSRELVNEQKSLSYFETELDAIAEVDKRDLVIKSFLGIIFASIGFNFIFGGDFINMLGVLIASTSTAFVNTLLSRAEINSTFNNFTSSFVGNIIVGALSSYTFLINNVSAASIAILMGLVPGMMLTNSIREILSKGYTSGLNKLAEGIFVAVSLAMGSAFALMITNLGG